MASDPDDTHKWFTAGEAALIARRDRVPGVPWTREGMAKRLKATLSEKDTVYGSRRRLGQKGGGGTEFNWTFFPEVLWNALDEEVGRRAHGLPAASDEDAEWFTAQDIATIAHVHELESIPRYKTYVIRWLARRARRRPKTFGAQLKMLRRGVWPSPSCEFHMSLFTFDGPLYAALEHCAAMDRER